MTHKTYWFANGSICHEVREGDVKASSCMTEQEVQDCRTFFMTAGTDTPQAQQFASAYAEYEQWRRQIYAD